MEELLNKIVELVDRIRYDAAKVEDKGNNAAGTRVRKAMQEIKQLAQDVRVKVSETRKLSKD